jgi:NADPH:quinone reductase-like Zn-dependent oxidoreductase
VHARFPLSQAAEAHRTLEAGGVVGKLLLVAE